MFAAFKLSFHLRRVIKYLLYPFMVERCNLHWRPLLNGPFNLVKPFSQWESTSYVETRENRIGARFELEVNMKFLENAEKRHNDKSSFLSNLPFKCVDLNLHPTKNVVLSIHYPLWCTHLHTIESLIA